MVILPISRENLITRANGFNAKINSRGSEQHLLFVAFGSGVVGVEYFHGVLFFSGRISTVYSYSKSKGFNASFHLVSCTSCIQ